MENEIINRIRNFNRFYVRFIGLLESSILNSGYSLTEAHILQVLFFHPDSTASAINKELKLDEGYLSRAIKKLVKKSLIRREQSSVDKRAFVMNLTAKGRNEYMQLDAQSSDLVHAAIEHLDENEQLELAGLMERVKFLFTQKEVLK